MRELNFNEKFLDEFVHFFSKKYQYIKNDFAKVVTENLTRYRYRK